MPVTLYKHALKFVIDNHACFTCKARKGQPCRTRRAGVTMTQTVHHNRAVSGVVK